MEQPSLLASAEGLQRLMMLIGAQAASQVLLMWEQTSDWALIVEMYPQLVDQWANAAGQLTAQWYHDLAPDKPFETRVEGLPVADTLRSDLTYARAQKNPAQAMALSAERHVFNTSRETVAQNSIRENVRYARLARADACPWCQILATNEPRYLSKESAERSHSSRTGHKKCYCVGVPVRDSEPWEPPDYVAGWRDKYTDARGALGTTDLNDLAKKLRNDEYPDRKDEINRRRRKWYAETVAAENAGKIAD